MKHDNLRHLPRAAVLTVVALASLPTAAHIGYSGTRNLGTLTHGTPVSVTNQVVTGNYGWADAADSSLSFNQALGSAATVDNLYLGDSHKARAFRFHLDSALTVTITASANATATGTSVGGLIPAFSVYAGLAAVSPFSGSQTSADYDFNPASEAWRTSWAVANVGAGYDFNATQGNWNAKGDWMTGGDGDPAGVASALSLFTFKGFARDTDMNGSVTGTFTLGAGDYSIFLGGDDIANKASLDAGKAYGIALNVSAVPEPQAWLMMLAGLTGLGLLARRRG